MPYLISANYSEYDHDFGNDRCNDKYNDNAATSEELMIENAMKTISFLSCIKFIKWDELLISKSRTQDFRFQATDFFSAGKNTNSRNGEKNSARNRPSMKHRSF